MQLTAAGSIWLYCLSMYTDTQALLTKLENYSEFKLCLIPIQARPPGYQWADMTLVLKSLMRTTDPDTRGRLLGVVSTTSACTWCMI